MASQINFSGAAAGAVNGAAPLDPTALSSAPTDVNTLFGVSQTVFNQPLFTSTALPGGTYSKLPPSDQVDLGPNVSQSSTIGDALEAFYGMDPTSLTQLQQQLYAGGFYSSTYYSSSGKKQPDYGTPDEDTFAAYKTAVIRAARSGQTLNQVLDQSAQGIDNGLGAPGGAAGTPAQDTVRVYPGGKIAINETDPETIRLAANATAQQLLGRNLSDKEAQAIVDTVRSDEQKKGQQQAALDTANQQAQIQTNEAMWGVPASAVVQGGTPSGGSSGGSPQDVVAAITRAANETGVPVSLALAIAKHESGLNPTATGDNGTSFGLYQLHQGGELTAAGLTPQQAQDPYTNAKVALTQVAAVLQQHPDWTPGQIAAAAQRPADPQAYAADINGLLTQAGVPTTGVTQGGPKGTTTDVFLPPVQQEISTPITPQGAATQYINSQDTAEMQEYSLATQLQHFTAALHSMPGDTGAAQAKAVSA